MLSSRLGLIALSRRRRNLYNSGVTTHTLETHVYRLRQKIEPVKGEATLLLTQPGGYSLAM